MQGHSLRHRLLCRLIRFLGEALETWHTSLFHHESEEDVPDSHSEHKILRSSLYAKAGFLLLGILEV